MHVKAIEETLNDMRPKYILALSLGSAFVGIGTTVLIYGGINNGKSVGTGYNKDEIQLIVGGALMAAGGAAIVIYGAVTKARYNKLLIGFLRGNGVGAGLPVLKRI